MDEDKIAKAVVKELLQDREFRDAVVRTVARDWLASQPHLFERQEVLAEAAKCVAGWHMPTMMAKWQTDELNSLVRQELRLAVAKLLSVEIGQQVREAGQVIAKRLTEGL